MMAQNARTPPPKRWKRSFDMAHPSATRKDAIPSSDQPLSLVSATVHNEVHGGPKFFLKSPGKKTREIK